MRPRVLNVNISPSSPNLQGCVHLPLNSPLNSEKKIPTIHMDDKNRKRQVYTSDKLRIIFRSYFNATDDHGKHHHGDGHADHLANQPHGGHGAGGDSQIAFLHRAHDGVHVG